ncbi:restriction endonuclease subunit S [Gracilimonas mengyeensis]|uniref:Type I restriction enzyme, S subunit n=1 Tax=Gracilimonas mengyeensis TaxID=1302730 RepID=A0A521BP92_9BACT|nr:restriction endonuclease subunit S [Gracilimonas mengyeensis]SMO48380.1 type I restriction enzyme, S subunit [Gracilimonas mengyeensis]
MSRWEEVILEDIVEIKGRIGWKGYKKSDLRDSGPVVIGGTNIKNDIYLDLAELKHLSREKYEESPEIMLKTGDVLLVQRGSSVGDVGYYHGEFKEATINPTIIVMSDFKGNSRFLAYYLMSSIGQNKLNSLKSGSSIPAIYQKPLGSLIIKIPPTSLQDDISHFLSRIDDKIHLNQQTNETLEAMAQAIFKSWFVDFDPVRAKIEATSAGRDPNRAAMAAIAGVSWEDQDWDEIETALQQKLDRMTEDLRSQLHQTAELFPDELVVSEIGVVPKGWGIKSLEEIADYLNGRAMQKYPPEDGEPTLPVLKIAQLRKGDTEGADIATSDIPERFKIRNGDMIFSWSGSLLIRLWAGGDAALNQHLFKVTSEEYDQWFYYHWTKHHLDNFIRIAESKAVTMGHIKRSHLKEAKCAIPNKELLEIGGQHIEPLLQQSVKLNLESNQLAELRDTLLPKLISGEVGV